jgi:hypothetical protein
MSATPLPTKGLAFLVVTGALAPRVCGCGRRHLSFPFAPPTALCSACAAAKAPPSSQTPAMPLLTWPDGHAVDVVTATQQTEDNK